MKFVFGSGGRTEVAFYVWQDIRVRGVGREVRRERVELWSQAVGLVLARAQRAKVK